MLKALQDNVWVFSEKQQRYLTEDSALATQFRIEETGSSSADDAKDTASRPSARIAVPAEDAAARMEEMMARCRDFVREKADTYEERRREAVEAENRAIEARKREEAKRLQREWDHIAKWHRPFEDLERGWMAANDERARE